MKKLVLLLFVPLLMATQCEDDEALVPSTDFLIRNNSSFDLIYITDDAGQLTIESETSLFIAVWDDPAGAVNPSDTPAFDSIELFSTDDDGNLVSVYDQDPINDELWALNEPAPDSFEYILFITDDDLTN